MSGGYSDTFRDAYLSQVDYLRDYKPNPSGAVAAVDNVLADITGAADPAAAAVAAWGVPSPDEMWGGHESSGCTSLSGSGNDLTATNVTQSQTDATLDATVITIPDASSTAKLEAADTSVCAASTAAFAGILLCRYIGPSNARNLVGRRDTAINGNQGWDVTAQSDGELRFYTSSTTGDLTTQVTVNHGTLNQQVILFGRSKTSDLQGIWTREGLSTSSRYDEDYSSSVMKFSIGDNRSQSSGQNFALFMWFAGAKAETILADPTGYREAVAQWLAWEIA